MLCINGLVTPLAGVWIEIPFFLNWHMVTLVTPLAGVWIEIYSAHINKTPEITSLHLRECGLKS